MEQVRPLKPCAARGFLKGLRRGGHAAVLLELGTLVGLSNFFADEFD